MQLAAAIHAGGLSEGAVLLGLAQSAVNRLPVLLAARMGELGREPLWQSGVRLGAMDARPWPPTH